MIKKTKNIQYYEAVGRRKQAVARVRLYIAGKESSIANNLKMKLGEIYVNNKPIEISFPSQTEREAYNLPFKLTGNEGRFAVSIYVDGGGKSGQVEAITLGIARALQKIDKETYTPSLKKYGLLTRDARKKERRKVGTGGKARRAKQSPKR